MKLGQENNSQRETDSNNNFGWWEQETPPLPPSTVSLTTPASVEAGAFPFPVCSRRISSPLAANVAALDSQIANCGANAPGDKPNPVVRLRLLRLSRRYAVDACEPLIGCCNRRRVISNWRHEPRWLEGFSLVGGVPKVTFKPCILRVPYRSYFKSTGHGTLDRVTVACANPEPTRSHLKTKAGYKYKASMKLTHQMLHEAATKYCGWNKAQAKLLGVNWPLERGWLKGLIGKEISEQKWALVMAMRGLSPAKRKAIGQKQLL